MEELSGKDVLDNADKLNSILAELGKLKEDGPLKKELLEKFAALETAITNKRTVLKQERERKFTAACDKSIAELEELIRQIPQKTPEELNIQLGVLKQDFDNRMKQSPYAPEHLKDRKKRHFCFREVQS